MCRLIKDLHVRLVFFQDISLSMDVIIIVVLDAWGMILSHNRVYNLGDSIQMVLSYATIPTCENTYVNLHCELWRGLETLRTIMIMPKMNGHYSFVDWSQYIFE